MNQFEMVVLIVAIVMIASIAKNKMKYRSEARPNDQDETAMLHAEIARLKDRVGVLERVVTDKSNRLADEIDRL